MITDTMIDDIILQFDLALRSLFAHSTESQSANPAENINEAPLSPAEKQHSAALMRINHCGEICAQALYQGQAITARHADTKSALKHAAIEELDHLAWCQHRLDELDSHTSYLNPLWYAGSLSIGCIAGLAGDQWSLGFINETEKQVVRHLDSHLDQISKHDLKSQAIIAQMKLDEQKHATMAIDAGAAELPEPIKWAMQQTAKMMTTVTYYL